MKHFSLYENQTSDQFYNTTFIFCSRFMSFQNYWSNSKSFFRETQMSFQTQTFWLSYQILDKYFLCMSQETALLYGLPPLLKEKQSSKRRASASSSSLLQHLYMSEQWVRSHTDITLSHSCSSSKLGRPRACQSTVFISFLFFIWAETTSRS